MAPARIESPAGSTDMPMNLHYLQEKSRMLNGPVDVSEFKLLDQVFRHRAADPCQVPLLAFPKTDHADFEYFTGRDLNHFTDSAAWTYEGQGLRSVGSDVVGILGPTDIDWVITLFALSRVGKTVLILSPRLSAEAVLKLARETQCQSLIYRDTLILSGIVQEVQKSNKGMQMFHMLTRDKYDVSNQEIAPFVRDINITEERNRTCVVMHSAGSTGLPKAMEVTHARFTTISLRGWH